MKNRQNRKERTTKKERGRRQAGHAKGRGLKITGTENKEKDDVVD